MPEVEHANYCRDRARYFRELAQTSNSPETKAELAELARRYDLLADHAANKAKKRSGGGQTRN